MHSRAMGARGGRRSEEAAEARPPWPSRGPAAIDRFVVGEEGLVRLDSRTLAEASIELDGETEGINTFAESALHASLKTWLAGPGDRLEVSVAGRVVDLLRADGERVEVQTKRLDKIAAKVLALARTGKVRVVHPVLAESVIVRLDPGTGEVLSERRSPKRGDLWSIFDELVMAPSLIGARNVKLEFLLVRSREARVRDGKGSWRRRGDRVLSRDLVEVLESRVFAGRASWLRLLPPDLALPCDSASLGAALGIATDRARKVLYSFAKAGLLVEAGKRGRMKLYDKPEPRRKLSS